MELVLEEELFCIIRISRSGPALQSILSGFVSLLGGGDDQDVAVTIMGGGGTYMDKDIPRGSQSLVDFISN